MFIIPTIEKKNDRRRPTRTAQHSAGNFVRLQPDIYTVEQYPLSTLYGYELQLFSPFIVPPSSWQIVSIKNNADDALLSLSSSLGGLGLNTYYKKLNTLYPLLNDTSVILQLKFVVFTNLVGLSTDISVYTNQGCVLTQVNLTGHIATFSSTVQEFTLDSLVNTKTAFPIPAALHFTVDLDLSLRTPFTVYDLPTSIGQVDYVLYNNKMYNRLKSNVPVADTFTTRSGGSLLWI